MHLACPFGRCEPVIITTFLPTELSKLSLAGHFADSPPTTVAVEVLSGRQPERPNHPGLTDDLWGLTQSCWEQESLLRPGILEMVDRLRHISIAREGRPDGREVTGSSRDDLRNTSSRLKDVSSFISARLRLAWSDHTRYTRSLPGQYCKLSNLPNSRPALDSFHTIEHNGSETSPHGMEFGELDEQVGGMTTSGLCGLFRRVDFWRSIARPLPHGSVKAAPAFMSEKVWGGIQGDASESDNRDACRHLSENQQHSHRIRYVGPETTSYPSTCNIL